MSVMWACNELGQGLWAGPIDDCPDVIKYYAPYDGTKYDHVTTWSSLGHIKVGSGSYQIKLQNTYQNVEIGIVGSMNIGQIKQI